MNRPVFAQACALLQQQLGDPNHSLAITAAHAQAGVSTLALALAQRQVASGHPALLVELNHEHPGLKRLGTGRAINTADGPTIIQPAQHAGLHVCSLPDTHYLHHWQRNGHWAEQLQAWQQHYQPIILDLPYIAAGHLPLCPAESMARACDHTLLLVHARHTLDAQLLYAHTQLQQFQARISGVVVNDYRYPSLGEELAREVGRLRRLLPKTSQKLAHYLLQHDFLNTEH